MHKTLHPLVRLIDLPQAASVPCPFQSEFYTVLLIEGGAEEFLFGRRYYDYSAASLLFLLPGGEVRINRDELLRRKGRLLAFHPDLLGDTSLGDHIKEYSFFFYKPDEALHLSLREKRKATDCLLHIEEESEHPVDCHSKTLITRHIELLLDYCSRFYERQFITRSEAHQSIIRHTGSLVDEYLRSGKLKKGETMSAAYCAQTLCLSPSYLNDVLYFETGQNLAEYFQSRRMEAAKEMLSNPGYTAGQVAKKLGYPDERYFCRIFKMITGIAPDDYRSARN